LIRRFVSKRISDFVNETLKTEDVLQELAFVAFVVGHSSRLVQLTALASVKVISIEHQTGNPTLDTYVGSHTISTAAVHSSMVISFSLAKSCKCLIKPGMI